MNKSLCIPAAVRRLTAVIAPANRCECKIVLFILTAGAAHTTIPPSTVCPRDYYYYLTSGGGCSLQYSGWINSATVERFGDFGFINRLDSKNFKKLCPPLPPPFPCRDAGTRRSSRSVHQSPSELHFAHGKTLYHATR